MGRRAAAICAAWGGLMALERSERAPLRGQLNSDGGPRGDHGRRRNRVPQVSGECDLR